jgi:hypothetical protein
VIQRWFFCPRVTSVAAARVRTYHIPHAERSSPRHLQLSIATFSRRNTSNQRSHLRHHCCVSYTSPVGLSYHLDVKPAIWDKLNLRPADCSGRITSTTPTDLLSALQLCNPDNPNRLPLSLSTRSEHAIGKNRQSLSPWPSQCRIGVRQR